MVIEWSWPTWTVIPCYLKLMVVVNWSELGSSCRRRELAGLARLVLMMEN